MNISFPAKSDQGADILHFPAYRNCAQASGATAPNLELSYVHSSRCAYFLNSWLYFAQIVLKAFKKPLRLREIDFIKILRLLLSGVRKYKNFLSLIPFYALQSFLFLQAFL